MEDEIFDELVWPFAQKLEIRGDEIDAKGVVASDIPDDGGEC